MWDKTFQLCKMHLIVLSFHILNTIETFEETLYLIVFGVFYKYSFVVIKHDNETSWYKFPINLYCSFSSLS